MKTMTVATPDGRSRAECLREVAPNRWAHDSRIIMKAMTVATSDGRRRAVPCRRRLGTRGGSLSV